MVPKPYFKKIESDTYEVFCAIPVHTVWENTAKEALLGTVRKVNYNTWEPKTLQGEALPWRGTRKAATEWLMREYLRDPKTLAIHQDHPDIRMINLCRQIARAKSEGRKPSFVSHLQVPPRDLLPNTGRQEVHYEDDIIEITAGLHHGAVEITRQPMPDKGMPGTNPCTMVNAWGVCYRTHGESRYLVEHVEKLAEELGITRTDMPQRDIGQEVLDGVAEMVEYEQKS